MRFKILYWIFVFILATTVGGIPQWNKWYDDREFAYEEWYGMDFFRMSHDKHPELDAYIMFNWKQGSTKFWLTNKLTGKTEFKLLKNDATFSTDLVFGKEAK